MPKMTKPLVITAYPVEINGTRYEIPDDGKNDWKLTVVFGNSGRRETIYLSYLNNPYDTGEIHQRAGALLCSLHPNMMGEPFNVVSVESTR